MKATSLAIAAIVLLSGNLATAQPLVTGDLSVYYDFDELEVRDFISYVPDRSGNRLDGEIGENAFDDALFDGEPDIVVDMQDAVRGAGSIAFNTDGNVRDDYIAIGSSVPSFPSEVPFELIPADEMTIAVWLQAKPLEEPGASPALDMSIYQTRSAIGSFIHTQLQADGRFRMQLRGQMQSASIINAQYYTDGSTDNPAAAYPRGEWFHWAATYDALGDTWAMYYNGELLASGTPLLFAEALGDWGQGALLGLVPDINRQFVGKMDEFYLFTRALSAEEIATLATIDVGGEPLTGDYNGNATVEQADLDLVLLNWGDTLADPAAIGWVNDLPDGAIDQAELDKVLLNWGNMPMMAAAASVPEPASWVLAGAITLTFLLVKTANRTARQNARS